MIITSRNQISKDLCKFLDNNFSNNKTKFVLLLCYEVLNNSKMMIDDSMNYINIPDARENIKKV